MDEQTDGWMPEMIDGFMDGWEFCGQLNDGQVGGWMHGWMAGWLDGWRYVWVDGWKNVFLYLRREETILKTVPHKYNGTVRRDNGGVKRSKQRCDIRSFRLKK